MTKEDCYYCWHNKRVKAHWGLIVDWYCLKHNCLCDCVIDCSDYCSIGQSDKPKPIEPTYEIDENMLDAPTGILFRGCSRTTSQIYQDLNDNLNYIQELKADNRDLFKLLFELTKKYNDIDIAKEMTNILERWD